MTKEQLLERAETVHTRLRARIDRLPDAEDAPTERLCDAIRAEAMNGRSAAGRLRNQMLNVHKPKKSLDLKPLEAWRRLLVNATTHFEQELEAFELLPDSEQRRRYNEISAVRFALKVIANGPNTEQGDSPLANEWLIRAGLQPAWGQRTPFTGRGGLRMVTRRIADVEKRLSETFHNLERAATDAEALLTTAEITFAGREAVPA